MYRDCVRCGFTLAVELFPDVAAGRAHVCCDCWAANAAVWRVAAAAADGLIRLVAIDALLGLGYTRTARLIACGMSDWPTMRQLRGAPPRHRPRTGGFRRALMRLEAAPAVRSVRP